MENLTRRVFFKQASLGAATTGLLVVASPLTACASQAPLPDTATDLSTAEIPENLVIYLRDAKAGEIGLMIGTREIVHRDPDLVARLLKAVG